MSYYFLWRYSQGRPPHAPQEKEAIQQEQVPLQVVEDEPHQSREEAEAE